MTKHRPDPPAWELDWSDALAWKQPGSPNDGATTLVSTLGQILHPFDWNAWSKAAGATDWFDDPSLLASRPLEDVRRLFVALVRADRFSDGTLAAAVDRGVITAMLDRARELLQAAAARRHVLEAVDADITRLAVDAVVNAANERMLGGGGVDGAIHRAAGPGLLAACREVEEVRPDVRCPVGEARATGGFDLPARWVVHTVGPRWAGGDDGEATLLASAWAESLRAAQGVGARTVAVPAISTGVYGCPAGWAASIAVGACLDHLGDHADAFDRILLVGHGPAATEKLRDALERTRTSTG